MVVKQLEVRFHHISIQLNWHLKDKLPSNIVHNTKSDGQYMAVMTQGGKKIFDPQMLVDDDEVCEEMIDSKYMKTADEKAKYGMSNEFVTPRKLKPIFRPPPSFPQILKRGRGM